MHRKEWTRQIGRTVSYSWPRDRRVVLKMNRPVTARLPPRILLNSIFIFTVQLILFTEIFWASRIRNSEHIQSRASSRQLFGLVFRIHFTIPPKPLPLALNRCHGLSFWHLEATRRSKFDDIRIWKFYTLCSNR